MAFFTLRTDALLVAGQVVQNDPTRPTYVIPHTTGLPVGMVLDSAPVYGGEDFDNPVITGYSARVVYGGGDHAVQITPPAGYQGEIKRFDVADNGVITPVSTGGVGALVGLNPTWATWG